MPTTTSPGAHSASNWRSKTSAKPQSLAMAVRTEVSAVRAMDAQRPAVAAEASHQFGRQMLRVGGAAAVAAPENLVALQQAIGHADGGALEGLLLRVELADNGEVVGDGVGKDAGQVQRSCHTLLVHDELRIFPEPCWRRAIV